MSNEVRIETAEGAQYGVSSAAKAAELYPGCVVLGYLDGREYEGKSRRSRGAASGRATEGDGRDGAGTVAGDAGDGESAADEEPQVETRG